MPARNRSSSQYRRNHGHENHHQPHHHGTEMEKKKKKKKSNSRGSAILKALSQEETEYIRSLDLDHSSSTPSIDGYGNDDDDDRDNDDDLDDNNSHSSSLMLQQFRQHQQHETSSSPSNNTTSRLPATAAAATRRSNDQRHHNHLYHHYPHLHQDAAYHHHHQQQQQRHHHPALKQQNHHHNHPYDDDYRRNRNIIGSPGTLSSNINDVQILEVGSPYDRYDHHHHHHHHSMHPSNNINSSMINKNAVIQSDSISIISDCVQSKASTHNNNNSVPGMIISRPQHTGTAYSHQQPHQRVVAIQSKSLMKNKKSNSKNKHSSTSTNPKPSSTNNNNNIIPSWALDLEHLNDDSSMDVTLYSKQSAKTREILTKQLSDLRKDRAIASSRSSTAAAAAALVTHPSFVLVEEEEEEEEEEDECSSGDEDASSHHSVGGRSGDGSNDDGDDDSSHHSNNSHRDRQQRRGRSKVRRKAPLPRRDSRLLPDDDVHDEKEDREDERGRVGGGGGCHRDRVVVPAPPSPGGGGGGGGGAASSTAATYKHPTRPTRLDYRSNFMEGKTPPTTPNKNSRNKTATETTTTATTTTTKHKAINDSSKRSSSRNKKSSSSPQQQQPNLLASIIAEAAAAVETKERNRQQEQQEGEQEQPLTQQQQQPEMDSTRAVAKSIKKAAATTTPAAAAPPAAAVLSNTRTIDSMEAVSPEKVPVAVVDLVLQPSTSSLPNKQQQQQQERQQQQQQQQQEIHFDLASDLLNESPTVKSSGTSMEALSTKARAPEIHKKNERRREEEEEIVVLYAGKDDGDAEEEVTVVLESKESETVVVVSDADERDDRDDDEKKFKAGSMIKSSLDNSKLVATNKDDTALARHVKFKENKMDSIRVSQMMVDKQEEEARQSTSSPPNTIQSHLDKHDDPIRWVQAVTAAASGNPTQQPGPRLEPLLPKTEPSTAGTTFIPTVDTAPMRTAKPNKRVLPLPSNEPETGNSSLPELHQALQRGASLTELYQLASLAKNNDPTILEFRDENGNTPLHLACIVSGRNSASVQWWNPITQTTTKTTIANTSVSKPGKRQLTNGPGTPHHPYYDGDSLLLVIQLLFNLCPKNIERANKAGNLPLHLAIQSATATIKTFPSDNQTNSVVSHGGSTRHDQDNDSGEHSSTTTTALTTSKVWMEIIGKMIFEYPRALHLPNRNGQTPLDLAIHKMGCCPELVGLIQEEIRLLGDADFSDNSASSTTHFSSLTEQNCINCMCGGLADTPELPSTFKQQQSPQTTGYAGSSPSANMQSLPNPGPSAPILFEEVGKYPPIRRWHWFQMDDKCGIRAVIWQLANSRAAFITTALLVFAGLMLLPHSVTHRDIRVAFIGNSITFVNDLPRFMEALSEGHISQNSCLHGAIRLRRILFTGNGMYNKWQTENAFLEEITMDDDLYQYVPQDDDASVYGEPHNIYDFGACTVEQLLLGTDDNLEAYNDNGYYSEDGKNACFQDPVYFQYLQQRYLELAQAQQLEQQQEEQSSAVLQQWDYVVLNDQTLVPAIAEERELSEEVLKYVYAPYFKQINARPVLLMTHAYSSNASVNFDDDLWYLWRDVPTFSSALYQGYLRYKDALTNTLPPDQEPLLAPAGLAYLVIWEENFNMWERLFYVDGFHPTPHGTFLIGCVLYATLYERMPANIPEDVEDLWARARKMEIGSDAEYIMPIPTRDEAIYLAKVAERVVLRNYMPKSYIEDLST